MNTFHRLTPSPVSIAAFLCSLALAGWPLHAAAQENVKENKTEKSEPINNSDLNGETAMLIMLGEMQVSRGDFGAGYALIMDAARKSGDETLYKRAVEIALSARDGNTALDGAKTWKKAFPFLAMGIFS